VESWVATARHQLTARHLATGKLQGWNAGGMRTGRPQLYEAWPMWATVCNHRTVNDR
jgi:hypothetical protein